MVYLFYIKSKTAIDFHLGSMTSAYSGDESDCSMHPSL